MGRGHGDRRFGAAIEARQLARRLLLGAAGWVPAMVGLALLATGRIEATAAFAIALAGGLAVLILSIRRSLIRQHAPFARRSRPTTPDTGEARGRWLAVADPGGNFANRWAMYADLTSWLAERDWSGKAVAELGGSNGVLEAFLPGANFTLLAYPEYDLHDLHEVNDSSFDLAILDQTLEHLADPERALAEVKRVLVPGGVAIVTTPFLVPVHLGPGFGDYYRWTPAGLAAALERCGFAPAVRVWGGREAAGALLEDMYMKADVAQARGLDLSAQAPADEYPITVWAIATSLKSSPRGVGP
jgi:SAM-dependent methyltransferase